MPGEPPPSANPLEQLVELLVYAPVGLLYEYPEVIPRLVKRGRSQVQLAGLLARMAANQARAKGESGRAGTGLPPLDTLAAVVGPGLGEAAGAVCSLLARAITDLGTSIGLAPQQPPDRAADASGHPGPTPAADGPPTGRDPAEATADTTGPPVTPAEPAVATDDSGPAGPAQPLPIAGYDELTAREIVGLLGDLSPAQRQRVREHEQAHRGRRTILAKLGQLHETGT